MSNATLILGFLQMFTLQSELTYELVDILKTAKSERYYDTILCISQAEEPPTKDVVEMYDVDKIAKLLNIPVMQLKGNTSYYLWPYYNRELLALVPMSGDEEKDKNLLGTLWKTLRKSVKTRLLLLFRAKEDDAYLRRIFMFCDHNKAVNVLAVKESFVQLQELYTQQIFPKFEMITRTTYESSKIVLYPDHVENMHGFPLRLSIVKHSRNAYILEEVGNSYVLGGYVGRLFGEFAKIHNASVTFPMYDIEMLITNSEAFLDNDTYDISMELAYNTYISDRVYSHVYDYLDWCIMVPMGKPVPAYMYYVKIFDVLITLLILCTALILALVVAMTLWLEGSPVSWSDAILNIYVFNGMLGQSYKMESYFTGVRSFLYLLTCFGGMMVNTTYVTYLQTFNALSPTDRVINTLDDMRKSEMLIAIYKEEYAMLKSLYQIKLYEPVMTLVPTYEEFYKLRDNFDTRYAYPVPSSQWLQIEEQQKFFFKPRFRLSDICFVKMIGIMLPMQANSPYEETINVMIGQVYETGLIYHWKTLAFLEAIQSKRVSLMDNSIKETFESMSVEDTRLVVYLYMAMVCVASLCFLVELFWPRGSVCGRNIWVKLKKIKFFE